MVYMDSYCTSGHLIESLAKKKVYVAGTMRNAAGFPSELNVVPKKGEYVSKTVDGVAYFIFSNH